MRIAMLDDEQLELDRVCDVLEHTPMADGLPAQVHTFTSGQQLVKRLRQETFDLLILDWQVPDISGFDVLLWTQDHLEEPPPVIMLTGRTEEKAVVEALTAGAADYIHKPFRGGELVARVRNVLRHRQPSQSPVSELLAFGDIVFDTVEQVVYRGCMQVQLSPREYKLALLFFTNLGRPLSRQYVYDHLWTRDEEFSSRTLDTHIYRIRTKLGLTAENGWTISTVYGYGYRLVRQEKNVPSTD